MKSVRGQRLITVLSRQLWCWIKQDWSALRIYTYYLPIWICIFVSGVIYFSVGYHVFHHRNQLRNLTFSLYGRGGEHRKDLSFSEDTRDSGEKVGFVPSRPFLESSTTLTAILPATSTQSRAIRRLACHRRHRSKNHNRHPISITANPASSITHRAASRRVTPSKLPEPAVLALQRRHGRNPSPDSHRPQHQLPLRNDDHIPPATTQTDTPPARAISCRPLQRAPARPGPGQAGVPPHELHLRHLYPHHVDPKFHQPH